MMKRALILLAPAVLLAGCNKGVEMKNASVEQVAEAAKDAKFIDPGQWTSTTEIVSVSIDGLPAAQKQMGDAMSKQMVGRKQTAQNCVTEEEAKKPAAGLFAGGDTSACTYDNFKMAGGKLDATMTCKGKGAGAGTMHMTMAGDYAGDNYNVNVEMKTEGGAGMPGSGMTIKARNNGKRVGECKA